MEVRLDDVPVRFTPGGKLYIVDAIAALAQVDGAAEVWERLKEKKPKLKQFVHDHRLSGRQSYPVTDSDGWDHIQDCLFEYLIETDAP